MTLTLTIDDPTEATRLLNDVCLATQYDPGSGITKADWVRNILAAQLKLLAKRGETRDAQATISTQIDAIVIH